MNYDEQTGVVVVVSISNSFLSSRNRAADDGQARLGKVRPRAYSLQRCCRTIAALRAQDHHSVSLLARLLAPARTVQEAARRGICLFIARRFPTFSATAKIFVGRLKWAKSKAAIASREALGDTTCTHAILSRLGLPRDAPLRPRGETCGK